MHVIADAHIYDRHVSIIEKMIQKEPKPTPKLIIDRSVGDFYAFTKDHFKLEDYEYHEFNEEIPVAI